MKTKIVKSEFMNIFPDNTVVRGVFWKLDKWMGAIILINMVQWMPSPSCKAQLLPALSKEEIDSATLHTLGDANQFAVESIISYGKDRICKISPTWLKHTARSVETLSLTFCFCLLLTRSCKAVPLKSASKWTPGIFYSVDGIVDQHSVVDLKLYKAP